MMTIPVEIRKSEIHGSGIFALKPIRKGQVLWQYSPALDCNVSTYAMEYCEPRVHDFIQERGYLNPKHAHWVVCCDESQFWNFPRKGEEPNCILGGVQDGEHLILAARDIASGEELTITPDSDADFERKMAQYESAS